MRAFPGRRSRTLLCEHPFRFGRLGEAFSPLDRQAYSIRPRQRYLLISRDCFGSSALDLMRNPAANARYTLLAIFTKAAASSISASENGPAKMTTALLGCQGETR